MGGPVLHTPASVLPCFLTLSESKRRLVIAPSLFDKLDRLYSLVRAVFSVEFARRSLARLLRRRGGEKHSCPTPATVGTPRH